MPSVTPQRIVLCLNADADDPTNVLGITYGYLDSYDGYHSHEEGADEEDALPMAA